MYGDGDALVYGRETCSVSIGARPRVGFLIANCRQGGARRRKTQRFRRKSSGICAPPGLPAICDDQLYQNDVKMADRHADVRKDAWSAA